MQLSSLPTPAFVLDLDVLTRNIREYATQAKSHGKLFCPMTKTSKSTEIARMQMEAGVDGFLVGTVTEAEGLAPLGKPIMLAYPVLNESNLIRIYHCMRHTQVILALDSLAAAEAYHRFFSGKGLTVEYLLILDVGLHRLGIQPLEAVAMVREITRQFPHLVFRGISTHPGQVYGCTSKEEAVRIAQAASDLFLHAAQELTCAGFPPDIRATGATPTFAMELELPGFNMLRPGNYIFHDLSQISMGAAQENDCALTLLATIISRPAEDRFIMDCGSKCLALDRGAHGNAAFVGHGRVLGHPEIIVESLSEEVGKLSITAPTALKVGDRIRILPNHACPVANLAKALTGLRGDTVEGMIAIDLGN